MRSDIKERVNREAEFFDHQQSRRDGFETALSYLNNGIGWRRRNEVIRTAMRDAELEIGRKRAENQGMACDFRKMDAHNLTLDDGSLDVVFGVAILHHLEFPRAVREIHRVLRERGKIVFVEPLRHNPVARTVRWFTPHARTPDELPLGRPELRLLSRNFELANYYSEMFTVVGAIIAQPFFASPINPLTKFCDRADDLLVRMVPADGAYYRSVVI